MLAQSRFPEKPCLLMFTLGMVVDLLHDITYTAFKGQRGISGRKKNRNRQKLSLEEAVMGLDLNTYKVKEVVPKLTAFDCKNKAYPPFRCQRT